MNTSSPSEKLQYQTLGWSSSTPAKVRSKLFRVRNAIRAAAPDATEVISCLIPGYSYPGPEHNGMFAWFGLQSHHIGVYVRPPTIESHRRELAGYKTTKSAVHLQLDREIPIRLIQTLVRASMRVAKERGRPRTLGPA
ncbi:MAG: iron chaperone [Thermoplasmata archaeon]